MEDLDRRMCLQIQRIFKKRTDMGKERWEEMEKELQIKNGYTTLSLSLPPAESDFVVLFFQICGFYF